MVRGAWCNSRLKMQPLDALRKTDLRKDVLSQAKEKKSSIPRSNQRFSATGEKLVQETESECAERIYRSLIKLEEFHRSGKLYHKDDDFIEKTSALLEQICEEVQT